MADLVLQCPGAHCRRLKGEDRKKKNGTVRGTICPLETNLCKPKVEGGSTEGWHRGGEGGSGEFDRMPRKPARMTAGRNA